MELKQSSFMPPHISIIGGVITGVSNMVRIIEELFLGIFIVLKPIGQRPCFGLFPSFSDFGTLFPPCRYLCLIRGNPYHEMELGVGWRGVRRRMDFLVYLCHGHNMAIALS